MNNLIYFSKLPLLLLSTLAILGLASCDDEPAVPVGATNTVVLYEGPDFTGRNLPIDLDDYASGECIDLSAFGFNDIASSVEFDLKPGIKFELREHNRCDGAIVSYEGTGQDTNFSEEAMDNVISSFSWR